MVGYNQNIQYIYIYTHTRGVVNKFPDWNFRARTECSYDTSR